MKKTLILAAILFVSFLISLALHIGSTYKAVDKIYVQTDHSLKCVLTEEGKICSEVTVNSWLEPVSPSTTKGTMPSI